MALQLTGLPLAVIVMAAALPAGSNSLIFAQRYGALQAEASTTDAGLDRGLRAHRATVDASRWPGPADAAVRARRFETIAG